ncbi:Cullin-associated NEDD8-dissociated protein 1 [Camellia lanceoleosa]|uniref:Cullin-associated NEDD8-dissociated protein 1 n=1 Tax=Camellia lanceoleosa TaxID=1840588 RepID=A0ACC0IL55_9ERIC|nr:Cullin-associated NEDD8-dissociated protein 1 [Camellia lanceoleosa]
MMLVGDHHDAKISKLVDKCPSAILAVLDLLVDPLQKTIIFSSKHDAVKQEVDRNEGMIQSALRAIVCGGDSSLKFKNLMTEISKSPTLWEKYCSIRNE